MVANPLRTHSESVGKRGGVDRSLGVDDDLGELVAQPFDLAQPLDALGRNVEADSQCQYPGPKVEVSPRRPARRISRKRSASALPALRLALTERGGPP